MSTTTKPTAAQEIAAGEAEQPLIVGVLRTAEDLLSRLAENHPRKCPCGYCTLKRRQQFDPAADAAGAEWAVATITARLHMLTADQFAPPPNATFAESLLALAELADAHDRTFDGDYRAVEARDRANHARRMAAIDAEMNPGC